MNERILSYVRNPWITLAAGGVIGTALGAISMDIFRRRQLNEAIEVLENVTVDEQMVLDFTTKLSVEEMVEQVKETGATNVVHNLNDLNPGAQPEVIMERIVQPPEEYLERFEEKPEPVVVEHNVFDDNSNDEWDYKTELSQRYPDRPYIIHVDEFVADERGFDSQSTLTWYEGDQILTDSQDVPIYNAKEIAGELRFGHGSGNPNIVYIRNEKLRAEYEVIRDPGTYQETVNGSLDAVEERYARSDLKHSREPLRFRN